MFMPRLRSFLLRVAALILCSLAVAAAERPRLAVFTDIGGDPDDQQSMVRLLHYANEFDLELLVATAIRTRHVPNGPETRPQLLRQLVEAYSQVLPNFRRHATGWPEADDLRARILSGNPRYGRAFIGEGHDTAASRALIARIDAGSPERPLNLTFWGGQTDLAQALWRVKHERGAASLTAFVSAFRVYDVSDQDGLADWLHAEFPGMFYLIARAAPGRAKEEATFRGMYLTGDESLTGRAWVEENIQSRGPLGALYPVNTYTVPNLHSCMKEGDAPSWLFFLPLGGNDPRDPTKPGWGGHYQRLPDGRWGDLPARDGFEPRHTVSRWRPDFQRDFAKRTAWAVPAAAAAPTPTWETPPGWTETRGGAGGKVLRVTTLAATGPGSLAEALATEGPRIIEFTVAGLIDLREKSLKLTAPFVTVAGETAPSPGITITNGDLSIATHDVIVRHLRIRAGAGTRARKSGWEVDGLTTGAGAHDVIVDHCSLSWSTDENLSASGPPFKGATPSEWRKNTSHRITFSHCIVGEGLYDSTHSKGVHSMGTLVHDNATDIVILGNLYISNNDRNPLFKGAVRAAFVNNVIHNPGERIAQFGFVPSQWKGRELQRAALTLVGNVARKGPSSAAEMVFFEVWPNYGPCDFHLGDNLFFDATGKSLPAGPGFRDATQRRTDYTKPLPAGSGYEFRLVAYAPSPDMRKVESPPLWPPRLTARPAAETTAWVLANAGARPWDRDAVDRRLVEEARTGRGQLVDFESEIGGLPR